MKKIILGVFLTLFAVGAAIQPFPAGYAQAAASEASWLNKDAANRGVIAVRYSVKSGVKTKLMITKDGTSYTYNLASGSGQAFPLQLGNGNYLISVLEQVSGTKYRQVQKTTLSVKLDDPNAVYLNSVQNIRWQESGKAAKLAEELTKNAKTDDEKAKAIYTYIISKINYDKSLAANVGTDYLPDPERTLSTGKGICYDYASLYAAMLRSLNIPTKLVMGTSAYVKEYHAWNEVYLKGKWVTVDTTVDAGKANASAQKDFAKSSSNYKASKVY